MEGSGATFSVEAGSAVWVQYMLFQQRSAPNMKVAQEGTRKVFMQVSSFSFALAPSDFVLHLNLQHVMDTTILQHVSCF
jgi:hypothetical protein